MSVRLREIALAVHRGQATLVGEIAGYLVLLAADQCVKQPRGIHPDSVVLDPEGTVRLTGHAVSPEEAEQQLRALLSGLLVELRSPAPNLQRVAERRETRGLATLVLELEAALVPANRKAAKRSLARLVRDTKRAGATPTSLAPEVAAPGQAAPAPLPAVPGGAPLAPLALTPVAPGTFQVEPDFAQPRVPPAPALQPESEVSSQQSGAQQELTTVEEEESWASAQIAEARKKWTSDVPPVVEERGAEPDPSEQMAEARKKWTSEVPPVVAESELGEGSAEAESVEPPSPREEEEDLTLIDEQVRWDVLDEPEEAPSATPQSLTPPSASVEPAAPQSLTDAPASVEPAAPQSLTGAPASVEPAAPQSLTPPPVAQSYAPVASVVESSDSESVTPAPASVASDSASVESPLPPSASVEPTTPDSLTPPPVSTRARSPRPPGVKKRSSAPPVKKGVQQELFQWAEDEKSAPEPELQVTRPDLPPLRVVPREQLAAMIQLGNAWSSQTPPPAREEEALTPVREALEVSPVEEQLEQGEPILQLKEVEEPHELELRGEPVPESEPEPEREEEDILTQLWSGATVRELDEEPLFPFVLEEETAPLQDDVPLLEPEPLELPPRRPSDVGELLRKMRPSSRQK